MIESGHVFVCLGVASHEESVVMYLCVRGYQAITECGHVFVC